MSSQVNVWIVVGESNAGKSSPIRALTGVRDQNVYELETRAGIILYNMLVIPSALQEYYQIQPSDFIARVQGNYCSCAREFSTSEKCCTNFTK